MSAIRKNNRYVMEVTPGGVRLRVEGRPKKGGEVELSEVEESLLDSASRKVAVACKTGERKPIKEMSQKARREMRWHWNALPWAEVEHLRMVTLTYPANWRKACPERAVLSRQHKAFRMRWTRAFGAPQGVWALEFQEREGRPAEERQAPHIHHFLGCPVIETEELTGWVRKVWSEIVDAGDWKHREYGAHVGEEPRGRGVQSFQRVVVGEYLWRESGKSAQKKAPEGWAPGRYWGVWNFPKVQYEEELTAQEHLAVRRPLRNLRHSQGVKRPRVYGWRGMQVTGVHGLSVGPQLLAWAGGQVG